MSDEPYGAQRMLLREIAETSSRVSGTGGRLEKIGHLADTLRRLESEEIGIGVSYLSGELRQGRIGIGYSTLEKAAPSSAAQLAGITLRDVDAAFERIARISGRGSAGERITVLGDLLARATAEEQRFLQRLLIGELRQGAQEGLMVEAIARAADVSAADVRRAVMLAGGPTAVA
ncbi:MAG: ATP-dependent DNA ligase, partial [Gemmatimonadota bacterium]